MNNETFLRFYMMFQTAGNMENLALCSVENGWNEILGIKTRVDFVRI